MPLCNGKREADTTDAGTTIDGGATVLGENSVGKI